MLSVINASKYHKDWHKICERLCKRRMCTSNQWLCVYGGCHCTQVTTSGGAQLLVKVSRSDLLSLGALRVVSIPSNVSIYSVAWTPPLVDGKSIISRVPLLGGRSWAATWSAHFYPSSLHVRLRLCPYFRWLMSDNIKSTVNVTKGNVWACKGFITILILFCVLL